MKSEIYTIHLLKSSSIARQAVENRCGRNSKFLLKRLPLKQTLKELVSCLEVFPKQVFETLAKQIDLEIQERKAPDFLDEQLPIVLNTPSNLLYILDCDFSEQLLEQLFDALIIWNSIFEEEPNKARKMLEQSIEEDYLLPLVEDALYTFLKLHKKTEKKISIGKVLDDNHLLKRKSLTKLRNNSLKKGYTTGSDSSLLRVAIDSSCTPQSIREEDLDTLAIIYVKQQIKWIIIQLQEEAQALISSISTSILKISSLRDLELYIEFHALKAPANAWRKFFSRITSDYNEVRKKTSDLDRFHKALLEVWKKIPEILPCLILTGISIPKAELNSIWDKPLSDPPLLISIKSDKDTRYLMNRESILEQLKQDYSKRKRKVRFFS